MLMVYGDGNVVRDYIYIDDAVDGIIRIAGNRSNEKVFNLGSGKGTRVNQIIDIIQKILEKEVAVEYVASRSVDVPANVLDITKYRAVFGARDITSLEKGIRQTLDYLKKDWICSNGG